MGGGKRECEFDEEKAREKSLEVKTDESHCLHFQLLGSFRRRRDVRLNRRGSKAGIICHVAFGHLTNHVSSSGIT